LLHHVYGFGVDGKWMSGNACGNETENYWEGATKIVVLLGFTEKQLQNRRQIETTGKLQQ